MGRPEKSMTHASKLAEVIFLARRFRRSGILRDNLDSGLRSADFFRCSSNSRRQGHPRSG